MARVAKLYSYAGVYLQDLTATDVSWSADRGRSARRNASFSIPFWELDRVTTPGRRIRIYDGAAQRFEGSIDLASITRTPGSGMVTVSCRDKAKTYKLARFPADTAYEDLAASETGQLVTTATASSAAGAGEGIPGGRVYDLTASVYTAGGTYWVPPEWMLYQGKTIMISFGYWATYPGGWSSTGVNATGSILGGDYSAAFLVTAIKYRLDFYIDLYAQHAVTSVVVTTNGTVTVNETSAGGTTWIAYAAGTYRYLHVTIERTASPITCGVAVVGSTAHGAATVLTDGSDYWMPLAADADRYITLTLSAARNVLFLRWGLNDADRATRYTYNIQTSATGLNGSWTTVVTGAHGTPNRLCEHPLTLSGNLYLRVVVTSANAPVALRYAKAQNITAANDIGTLIQAIAATEGETSFDFTATRQYLAWVTYEQGEEKWAAMESLAQSIGFELFYSAAGVLTFRPANDLDVTLATKPTYSAMLTLNADWSDANIYNQIIAVYSDADVTYRSVQTNDNASSPTGTPNVGTRTAPIFRSTTANSQQKLDAWARYLLDLYSRQPAQGEFAMSAVTGSNPGDIAPTSLEPGDVVHLHDPASGIDGDFVVEAYTVSDTGREFDIRMTVSEVA